MKETLKYIVLLLLGIIPFISTAQKSDPDKIIESIIEGQIQNLDAGTDVGLIIEDLEELAENQLNINSCNETELSRLYILNDIQINKLLDYILEYGPAYSIFELNTIDGFSPELLRRIEPFIWFGPTDKQPEKLSDALKYGRHQLLLRSLGTIQKAKGYLPKEDGTTHYEGNQFRYYTRYRFEARDRFSMGITAEKDPGEAFFKGSNKSGFDFYHKINKPVLISIINRLGLIKIRLPNNDGSAGLCERRYTFPAV